MTTHRMVFATAFLVFALTACGDTSQPAAPLAAVGKPSKTLGYPAFSGDVPLANWNVSTETLTRKGALTLLPIPTPPSFAFPVYPQTRNYLIADVAYGLQPTQTLSYDFTVTASADAAFNCDDGIPTPAPMPCGVTPFFWTGNSLQTINERYWAFHAKTTLTAGVFHVEVPLTLANWFDVYGNQDPSAFASALVHVDHLGMTLGGSSTYGHGIGMASGSATFTLTRLSVH